MLSEAWSKAAARSLTSQAFNAGVSAASIDEGAYDVWLSVLLPTTRPAHRAAHGTATAAGVPFLVGGEYLMYPGDPDGSPGNTIGCRCIVVPSFDSSNIATQLTQEEIERLLGVSVVSGAYSNRMTSRTTAAHGPFTGAVVSLLPSVEDAARLAVEGFESPTSLHMTLVWLGDTDPEADEQPSLSFEETGDRVRAIAANFDVIEADVFAVAVFNPGDADPDRTPATVLLVQDETLADLRDVIRISVGDSSSFAIWLPHITLGYDLGESAPSWDVNTRMGPVTFDRLVVSYGSEQVEVIELGKNTDQEVRDLAATAMRRDLVGATMPPLHILSANIRAATLVDIPAFVDARISLIGDADENGMQPWEGPIAFVNTETGDARTFDVLTWMDPPLPLRWAQADEGWHMGAEVVGRIDSITQDGDTLAGRGVIDVSMYPGAVVAALIEKGMAGGISVDLDRLDVESDEMELVSAVTGAADLPIADREREWDGDAAKDRVFAFYTNAAGVDVAGISQAFLFRDDDADPTAQAAYKLGFADIVNDVLQIVPRGVFATAGGRGVDATDIPDGEKDVVKTRICLLYARLREVFDDSSIMCPFEDGDVVEVVIEASAWAALATAKPFPHAWFAEPLELPQNKGSTFFDAGRVFGWVARRGVPHEVLGKTPPLEDVDLTTFLRHELELDDGSKVCVGAFTMNVGHLRDGAECENGACQFDDTRTVAGIVTVGVNEGGMWFSGAAAPWLSEWDRSVFLACQPSGHWRYENRHWSLRAVLTVPVPGYPTPLAASAVVHRANTALRAVPEPERVEGEATVLVRLDPEQLDEIAASVIGQMKRQTERDALSERVKTVAVERMEEKVHGVQILR